jgi:hypothetical protein
MLTEKDETPCQRRSQSAHILLFHKFFLNSGTTWASFNFSGKMELFIDLFIKFVIG